MRDLPCSAEAAKQAASGLNRASVRRDESAGARHDLRADPADRPSTGRQPRTALRVRPPALQAPGRAAAFAHRPSRLLGRDPLAMGPRRARRARRLQRQPIAADRSACGAQAPAQHRDPQRRRLAYRQSRRHRRPGGEAHRPAALPAQGVRGDRGPAVLRAYRHRSRRRLARALPGRNQRERRRGRFDLDPAARQEPVPDAGRTSRARSRRRSWRSGSNAAIPRIRSSSPI